jgi:phosphoenolpyruvate-protein kinase (PTS system EI component)
VKLLFPMVAGAQEIIALKEVLAEVEEELRLAKLKYSDDYKFGIMLELPSVLLELDSIIEMVDYMSVGSNDLLQYTFALDRCNENVSELYTNLHPDFLRILDRIGKVFAKRPDKELAICGEMAASSLATPLLIGAGFRDMSVAPRRIPSVKRLIKAFTCAECREILDDALKLKNAAKVKTLLKARILEKGLPPGN